MKKITAFLSGFVLAAALMNGCSSPAGGESPPSVDLVVSAPLDLSALVALPVKDTPQNTSEINTTQYTGTIAWQKTDGSDAENPFLPSTVYKAVITLAPKPGYTFEGFTGTFTYAAATGVSYAAPGVVTFLNLTALVPQPVQGANQTVTADHDQYGLSIAWQKTNGDTAENPFAPVTVYKAVVTLSPKPGWTLSGLGANSFTHSYADGTPLSSAGGGEVTITFYATTPAGGYLFTTLEKYRTMVPLAGGGITTTSGSSIFISGRTVTLSAFKIARYETTWELWKEVYDWATDNARGAYKYTFANLGVEGHGTTGTGTAAEAVRKTRPVTMINWRDAVIWCNAYSEMSGKAPVYYTDSDYGTVLRASTNTSGFETPADLAVMKSDADGYRLPTEAEWEYAARGGDQTDTTQWAYTYAGTSTAGTSEGQLGDYAWYQVNSYNLGSNNPAYGAHPVGTKASNKETGGLYDMSGNVWEWCWDWDSNIDSSTPDTGAASGYARVRRGGGWDGDATYCAVAYRSSISPFNNGADEIGFRVACP